MVTPTQGLWILTQPTAYLRLQINSSQLGSSMPVEKVVTPTSPEDVTGKAERLVINVSLAVTPNTWNMASSTQNYPRPDCLLAQG